MSQASAPASDGDWTAIAAADLRQRLLIEQAILDNASVGILLSQSGTLQRVNKRFAEMFGYTPAAMAGLPSVRLFPDASAYESFAAPARVTLGSGRTYVAEAECLRADGSPVWVKFSGHGLVEGDPTMGTIWIAEDVTEQRRIHLEKQQAITELSGILNTAAMGIALLRNRTIDRCNQRLEELFGYPPGELNGASTRLWYPDDDTFIRVGQAVYAELKAGREAMHEAWFQRRDGSRFYGRLAGRAFDPRVPLAGSVWILEDLTIERAEREELLLARKVFEVNSEAIMVTDTRNRIVRVNAAFERITGYTAAEVIGENPRVLGSGRHDAGFFADMWTTLRDSGHWSGEIWDRHKDGREYPKWLRIDTIRDASHQVTHYVAVFSDISERKASEEHIRYLAQHDALTGLPNRYMLTLHLEHALTRAERQGDKVGLMFIDLDNFKSINDTLGHQFGDALLCEVARRITKAVRRSDIVARLGGDEFVIVLENPRRARDAGQVAQKIIDQLGQSIPVDGHNLHTTPSIGIGIYPDDGETSDILMKNADVAMYHAKAAGRNNYQFYAEHMNRSAAQRIRMEARLRAAMNGNEFELFYQPQLDLDSGRVIGCEALIRWNNPELGQVPPADFIPLAEEIGLIVPLSEWVLRAACRTARDWLEAGVDFGSVSVNISPNQFRLRNFAERVEQILHETGLPFDRLELEITETTLMETAEVTVTQLGRLKNLGITLAVDDFGTGYSSLAYLKRFPIDRLKIDRSFVADLDHDASASAIAGAVLALARALDLEVVAEGVETAGQRDFLRQQGCDSVQGYFYSRPLPAAEFVAYCASSRA